MTFEEQLEKEALEKQIKDLKEENEDLRKLCHEKDISNDDLVRRLTDFSDKYYILLEICSSLCKEIKEKGENYEENKSESNNGN